MTSILIITTMLCGSPAENRKKWLPVVKSAARHYKLDWQLLDILIQKESKWRINARSKAGAKGLGQLMPETSKELGVVDPYDPGQNIWGSALYIRKMYNMFGRWDLALAAYNAGPTTVKRCMCVPNIKETRNYVNSIMHTWVFK